MTKVSQIREKLRTIIKNDANSIRAEVAKAALEYQDDGDPVEFFNDLAAHGMASGMVPNMIYYSDTHSFFERHYDEISDEMAKYLEETGERLKVNADIKNFYAWFSFELVAYALASELYGF